VLCLLGMFGVVSFVLEIQRVNPTSNSLFLLILGSVIWTTMTNFVYLENLERK